ncbi:uncharacterized protein HD556DRAFT_1449932 [Suillus plorans]|uniref:Zn(2)-C6 fungal-type domain-containing protein n=1 Tax=Suillus plorans TaxID=116603 RepID=A0A9P7ADP0_9AGAM|nr:uncharacterized protein HD556DRAFT_1449932 [Suillus plorans]KAG1786197.1 hypothetical protein HD556DRAFT_1449932 [Suillus plorans]
MSVPPEAANDALKVTLAVVQSLMKRCIKVKEGDPEALKLSDEIARRVARDLKLYAGTATSFSPLLLSCAAIIWQYSRGGAFQSVPDWTSVTDDDPRIKDHPRFQKTVHYHPPSALDVPVIATSSIPTTIPATTSALIVPPFPPSALPSLPSRTDLDLVAKPVAEPRRSSRIRARKNPSRTDLDMVARPVAERKRSSRPRVLKNLPPLSRPAHPPLRYRHLYVAEAEREQWKALFEAGDSKKRKADDEDTDGADVIEAKLASTSQEPMKKKRKLNQNVDNRPTGIINVKPKTLLTVTTDKVVPPGDEKAFWDADTRPAEWGSDAHIATPCQHSVHYHPRQCDKCTKLDIPCIVLPDKKFGYIRLACANCDQMKITCAIDGVGVRQRMQAKAATAIVEEEKQQPGPPAGVPMCKLPTVGTSPRPEQDDQPAPANIADPEPTARDILQGIRDLSKRLDLFATNDRVDALEIRVRSVENILHQWLNALEQRLNASDAR